MEITGNLHYNLFNYLNSLGKNVLIVNPLSISKFRESEMIDIKTDIVDCQIIAEYTIRKKDLKPTIIVLTIFKNFVI